MKSFGEEFEEFRFFGEEFWFRFLSFGHFLPGSAMDIKIGYDNLNFMRSILYNQSKLHMLCFNAQTQKEINTSHK